MRYKSTGFKDLVVCEPTVFGDERGYFFEAFNNENFRSGTGLEAHFVQDNQSLSSFGVLRGLHMQEGQDAQAKLVRVLRGRVLDVVLDLRKDEPTFGEHFSIELTAENKKQLFVPRGFAHGFIVLSEVAEFFYKCDNYYKPESEMGVLYNDPELQIDWILGDDQMKISAKDSKNESFDEIKQKILKN